MIPFGRDERREQAAANQAAAARRKRAAMVEQPGARVPRLPCPKPYETRSLLSWDNGRGTQEEA